MESLLIRRRMNDDELQMRIVLPLRLRSIVAGGTTVDVTLDPDHNRSKAKVHTSTASSVEDGSLED